MLSRQPAERDQRLHHACSPGPATSCAPAERDHRNRARSERLFSHRAKVDVHLLPRVKQIFRRHILDLDRCRNPVLRQPDLSRAHLCLDPLMLDSHRSHFARAVIQVIRRSLLR